MCSSSVDVRSERVVPRPMPRARQWTFPSVARIVIHAVLIIGAFLSLFPFLYMLLSSLKTLYEATAFPPTLIPKKWMWSNYTEAWNAVPFGPVVKAGGITKLRVDFWWLARVVVNYLAAWVVVSWLWQRVDYLRRNTRVTIGILFVTTLPATVALLLKIAEFVSLMGQRGQFIPGYFLNTIFVALIAVPTVLITSILAAYAFARMDFFGKNVLFIVFLSTMMIPFEAILIPDFIIVTRTFGWYNTFKALIIPFTVSAFNIFLLRQFFMTIPKDYYDAALLDGAGHLGFLRYVVIPLSQAPLAVVALFTFLGTWNSFQWPLIVADQARHMIQVGMSGFRTEGGSDVQLIMAAATFTILPVVILYFFTQRTFIESVASTGLKG